MSTNQSSQIRAKKHISEFYMQSLRKYMKRKTKRGVGMSILNNRIYNQKWRPLLPLPFKKKTPKLSLLIEECWATDVEVRPGFDSIVRRIYEEIREEVRVTHREYFRVLGEMKVMVSKKEHDKVVASKDRMVAELKGKVEDLERRVKEGEAEAKSAANNAVKPSVLKKDSTSDQMQGLMASM